MRETEKNNERELSVLLGMRDEEIDTSDVHELSGWDKAVVGKFYRPVKEPVTLRLDADVLAWLRGAGTGYQTRINGLLRAFMSRKLAAADEQSRADLCDEGAVANSGSDPEEFLFPSLAKHHELERSDKIAQLIQVRGSVFASVA